MKTRLYSLLIPLLLLPLFAGCATVRQRLGTTLITPAVEQQLGEQVAAQVERILSEMAQSRSRQPELESDDTLYTLHIFRR